MVVAMRASTVRKVGQKRFLFQNSGRATLDASIFDALTRIRVHKKVNCMMLQK